MKTFRLSKFRNVGPSAYYAKFPKILTKGQTKYLRPNSQIFTIKMPSFQRVFCLFKLDSNGVLYSILLYVVCHCVICVVDCGAYMGSENHIHQFDRVDGKHNLTRFKSVKVCTSQHGHGEEVIQPDSLETICPTRCLTRLSASLQ